MCSGWTMRNLKDCRDCSTVAALIKEYPSRKGSARSYLVAPQRMQLLVIAKGKRVNCDEKQMIEVVNVTETICCGLCRLTTTIAIIFEMGTSAALKLKRDLVAL